MSNNNAIESIAALMASRMSKQDVCRLTRSAVEDPSVRMAIEEAIRSGNQRVSNNALWILTHMPETEKAWLKTKQHQFIEMLLTTDDTTTKRLLLQLLRTMDYDTDSISADLLDYCLMKINSECESYAVRCFSLYTAYRMCRTSPELLSELKLHVEMLEIQQLSPGLKSALRQIKKKLSKR